MTPGSMGPMGQVGMPPGIPGTGQYLPQQHVHPNMPSMMRPQFGQPNQIVSNF